MILDNTIFLCNTISVDREISRTLGILTKPPHTSNKEKLKELYMSELTQKQLKELLHYNPETGVFVWKVKRGGSAVKNSIAGAINGKGYRVIRITGRSYLASRLSYLYTEGYFPEHQVDHKNRNRSDDRWCNLRHVTRQCNLRNCGIREDNKSGVTGVSWDKRDLIWRAYIAVEGKVVHLGSFDYKINAIEARWEAEQKYGYTDCNTISSAHQYLKRMSKVYNGNS